MNKVVQDIHAKRREWSREDHPWALRKQDIRAIQRAKLEKNFYYPDHDKRLQDAIRAIS